MCEEASTLPRISKGPRTLFIGPEDVNQCQKNHIFWNVAHLLASVKMQMLSSDHDTGTEGSQLRKNGDVQEGLSETCDAARRSHLLHIKDWSPLKSLCTFMMSDICQHTFNVHTDAPQDSLFGH